MVYQALVLAGGLGTRLRSVVNECPKPMALVAGRPFLQHLLDYWITQGINEFILLVGYKYQQIFDYFGHSYATARIHYQIEGSPLGTGGALLKSLHDFPIVEPFLLLNGDTYFPVPLEHLIDIAQKYDPEWIFSLFLGSDPHRYLPVSLSDTGIVQLSTACNSPSLTIPFRANGGVYLVQPRALRPLHSLQILNSPLSLETNVFAECQKLGQYFHGYPCDSTFIDIGIPADYQLAQGMDCFIK